MSRDQSVTCYLSGKTMKVVCVAVIGKSNNPLYIKCYDGSDTLKFHYIVHSALDVIEDKSSKKGQGVPDLYLGMLYPTEDYKVYGYSTNSKVKFIIVVQEDNDTNDQSIRNVSISFPPLAFK